MRSLAWLLILMCATAALAGCTGKTDDDPQAATSPTQEDSEEQEASDEPSTGEPSPPPAPPAPQAPPTPQAPPAPSAPPAPPPPQTPTCRITSSQNGVPSGPGLVAVPLLNWTPELPIGGAGNETFAVPDNAWAISYHFDTTNFTGSYNFSATDGDETLWEAGGITGTISLGSDDNEQGAKAGAFDDVPAPGNYTFEYIVAGTTLDASLTLYAHVCVFEDMDGLTFYFPTNDDSRNASKRS